ncbi:MAG: SDR family NAD(P)-dependent oxidoreductase [Trueperaceae bacterium]
MTTVASKTTKQTALITGASGGIGLDLAREFAKDGYNLVLVARSKDKLDSIAADFAKQYNINATVIAKDLAKASAPDELYNELKAHNIQIDALVNNAGFATYGKFVEIPLEKELQEMQLNMVTLTHLSKIFGKDMVARRNGKILNIASTAAFQPGPLMAVYYATKAYVLSFSEALANEMEGTGVTVTVLCPGPTESGFQERAAMQESKLIQKGGIAKMMTSKEVAEQGYQATKRGQVTVIPGFANQFGTALPRLLPRKAVTRIVRGMQDRVGH